MKKFLASTATVVALSTGAFAQSDMATFNDMAFDRAVNLNASELIGMRVYASEADIENNSMIAAGGEAEWDDIGEINEIVITRDGEVQSVIVGVGGFIGIGEKDVAVSMDQIRFVSEEGDSGDLFLVVNANAAGVTDAPEYSNSMMNDAQMGQDTAVVPVIDPNAPVTDANAPVTDANAPVADANAPVADQDVAVRTPLNRTMVEREGYADVDLTELTTEDLTGARVYGAGDEDIGEVNALLLTDDGKLDRAVIGIGGFLGLGEHSVAIPMDELQIIREDGGDDLRVYIESSKEALKAQPEYEG